MADEESGTTNEPAKEIQSMEQSLQNLLYQKQAFQMETAESEAALKQIESSKEVFKIIGQLMIKSTPERVKEELANKEKLLKLRIQSIEKQEAEISERLKELKKKSS